MSGMLGASEAMRIQADTDHHQAIGMYLRINGSGPYAQLHVLVHHSVSAICTVVLLLPKLFVPSAL